MSSSISFLCFLMIACRLSFCAAVTRPFSGVHSSASRRMPESVSGPLRPLRLPTSLTCLRTSLRTLGSVVSCSRGRESASEMLAWPFRKCRRLASCVVAMARGRLQSELA